MKFLSQLDKDKMKKIINDKFDRLSETVIETNENLGAIFRPEDIDNYKLLRSQMVQYNRMRPLEYINEVLYDDLDEQRYCQALDECEDEKCTFNTQKNICQFDKDKYHLNENRKIRTWTDLIERRRQQFNGQKKDIFLSAYLKYILTELNTLLDMNIFIQDANPSLLLTNSTELLWRPQISIIMEVKTLNLFLNNLLELTNIPISIIDDSLVEYEFPIFETTEMYYGLSLILTNPQIFNTTNIQYYTSNLFFTTLISMFTPKPQLSLPKELIPESPLMPLYQPTHI